VADAKSPPRHDVLLGGCSPEPLAHYLKGIGILRVVAEQIDHDATTYWRGDELWLRSTLDEKALRSFFFEKFVPTPIIAPWNGGSGFFPKDNAEALSAIAASTQPRLEPYRRAIATARSILSRLGVTEKPDSDRKVIVVDALRAELEDSAIAWLDAALILSADEGLFFPPLLGTGGNDGRLEFTKNQMERVQELFLEKSDPLLLDGALFGATVPGLTRKAAIGQFLPSAAGGANAGPGFDRESLVNAWDYLLMLEGAVTLTGAASRRLQPGVPSSLAFPFLVRAAGAGYASSSSSDEDETRGEMWMPLWPRPLSLREVRALFGEGRAKVRGLGRHDDVATARDATTGVDFARAVAGLGVQRGVDRFTRFGFHTRNGLAYLATPLGRWNVKHTTTVDLLAEIDGWLQRFRRVATDRLAPASWRRVTRQLEEAILDLTGGGSPLSMLIALGAADGVIDKSRQFAAEKGIIPLRALSPAWIEACHEDTTELRLAVALSAAGIRRRIVHARGGTWPKIDDGATVFRGGGLIKDLIATSLRIDVERAMGLESCPREVETDLDDLARFIDHDVDDDLLEDLIRGCALVGQLRPRRGGNGRRLPLAFSICALANARELERGMVKVPRTPGLVHHLAAGHMQRASELALRRLRGLGFVLRDRTQLSALPDVTNRIAAALAFPLSPRQLEILTRNLFPKSSRSPTNPENEIATRQNNVDPS
jgi:CRISPR-associated protein Csx17